MLITVDELAHVNQPRLHAEIRLGRPRGKHTHPLSYCLSRLGPQEGVYSYGMIIPLNKPVHLGDNEGLIARKERIVWR